jgi:hypothetical protein
MQSAFRDRAAPALERFAALCESPAFARLGSLLGDLAGRVVSFGVTLLEYAVKGIGLFVQGVGAAIEIFGTASKALTGYGDGAIKAGQETRKLGEELMKTGNASDHFASKLDNSASSARGLGDAAATSAHQIEELLGAMNSLRDFGDFGFPDTGGLDPAVHKRNAELSRQFEADYERSSRAAAQESAAADAYDQHVRRNFLNDDAVYPMRNSGGPSSGMMLGGGLIGAMAQQIAHELMSPTSGGRSIAPIFPDPTGRGRWQGIPDATRPGEGNWDNAWGMEGRRAGTLPMGTNTPARADVEAFERSIGVLTDGLEKHGGILQSSNDRISELRGSFNEVGRTVDAAGSGISIAGDAITTASGFIQGAADAIAPLPRRCSSRTMS